MARDNIVRPDRFAASGHTMSVKNPDLMHDLLELRQRALIAGEQAYLVHTENMTIVRRINELLGAPPPPPKEDADNE